MSSAIKRGLLGVLIIGLGISILLLSTNRLRIALRITPGFEPLSPSSHVFFEEGAQSFARQLEGFYAEAVTHVEEAQARPFKSRPRIYISASHGSFVQHLGMPENSPVRGLAFSRDVWLSPLAFTFGGKDTHRESVLHELSHVHFTQQLGYWRRAGDIPGWFSEGLSDWTASMAAHEQGRQHAILNIKNGRTFTPDSTGRLPIPRLPQDYGLPGPLFQHQVRLFVDYLDEQQSDSMPLLLEQIYAGSEFTAAFNAVFGSGVAAMWNQFVHAIQSDQFPR